MNVFKLLRAAFGEVKQNTSQARNGNTVSFVDNVLRVACGTSSICVEGLAKWIHSNTSSVIHCVSRVAGSAASIGGVLVAVIVNRDTSFVGVEDPSF